MLFFSIYVDYGNERSWNISGDIEWVRHDFDHFIKFCFKKPFFKVNFVLYKLYFNFNTFFINQ